MALLQLKILWGAWVYRDLTTGDTTSYFVMAEGWLRAKTVNLLWSPLYTAFYGTLLSLTPDDAYLPTVLHRMVIAVVVSLLVLGVFRRLLTPGLALAFAAWWAVLPVTFNSTFEVHLFGTIPILAAWLVILGPASAWRRGTALAILAAGVVLVRNELSVATGTLGAICLAAEVRAHRRGAAGHPRISRCLLAYLLPLAAATAISGAAYTRSIVWFPELPAMARPKHTLNMCQVYTFGYKQRHPEWTRDHWTDCSPLMIRDFGNPLPTLGEMIRANPRAVATHFLWNASLTGNGMQVTLFNAMSGHVTPDYGPVKICDCARTASLAALVIVLAGLVVVARNPRRWWSAWIRDRRWGWLAILAMAPVWALVIITQRPRPSYLLSLGAASMAVIGTGVVVTVWLRLIRRVPWLDLTAGLSLVASLIVMVPPFYTEPGPRPLLELYRRLRPFQDVVAAPDTVLLVNRFGFEIANLVGRTLPRVVDYDVLDPVRVRPGLAAFLDASDINLVYANEALTTSLGEGLDPSRWLLIGSEDSAGSRWQLWRRRSWPEADRRHAAASQRPAALLAPRRPPGEPAPSVAGIGLGMGWLPPPQRYQRFIFLWATNDAEISVDPSPAPRRLTLLAEPGPNARALPLDMEVRDSGGTPIQRFRLAGRETVTVEVPAATRLLRLHTDGGAIPAPGGAPPLNFRIFEIAWADAPAAH